MTGVFRDVNANKSRPDLKNTKLAGAKHGINFG